MYMRYNGQSPFYEVWYGKINFPSKAALWFRYTLLSGKTKESALWAIYFSKDNIVAQKETHSLKDFTSQGGSLSLPNGFLSKTEARGILPRIQWNFTYRTLHGENNLVPSFIKTLHLSKSLTTTPVLDGRFTGEVIIDGQKMDIQDGYGSIGHVWGKRHAHEWAWAHCNQFDESGVLFEGLSAKLSICGIHTRPLTSLYLKTNDSEYHFNRPRDLLFSGSVFKEGYWNFEAHSESASLVGRLRAFPKNIATITYTDTDDSLLYCHNSKLSSMAITLVDHDRRTEDTWTSFETSAFEWVTRTAPSSPPLL